MVTSVKSLKCPACSAASCRLSTKVRSLRALASSAPSGMARSERTIDMEISVVADDRPSWSRVASLAKSLPRCCS